jgi:2-methylcitrate dehydratase PrpD
VAAALVKGRLGVAEITGVGLTDPQVRRLVEITTVQESADYSARFPANRWGDVTLRLKDGRRLASGPLDARGGPENPLSEAEIIAKFRDYTEPAIGKTRAAALETAVRRLMDRDADFTPVLELCCGA